MEIGSFIELQLPRGKEYYKGEKIGDMDIVRLNSGRAAIFHAFLSTGCKSIWIPYYQCESVSEFLIRNSVRCKYYNIDKNYNPINLHQNNDEAVLLVNYFGIMSWKRMSYISSHYKNVIIDNSQAFFSNPVEKCLNVYSARKFIGVPDGAYVIGNHVSFGIGGYKQGYSSDTSLFMLQRIEYGCEGDAYASRCENEKRIDTENCMLMSKLTQTILDGTNYKIIQEKRKANFVYAHFLFGEINRLNPMMYYDDSCVPMVYPLLIEDENLLERMLKAGHFQGHWWKWVEDNGQSDEFEKWISRYMIPVTIDQRYGKMELDYIKGVVDKK